MSLDIERAEWETEALAEALPTTIHKNTQEIAGVECTWIAESSTTNPKVVVYLHGGGLVAGSVITHQAFASRIAQVASASVLLVNYRLLPENSYPAPLDDVLSVYKALISEHSLSPRNIIIGGDSSGGGLALAALVCARNSGLELPLRAFMLSGTFDMTLSSISMSRNTSTDKHLSKAALQKWQADYLKFNLESPLLSPLYADLAELPPLLLIAGGNEPWVSDSENAAYKVKKTGGQVSLKIWPTMEHVFVMNSALPESDEALDEIANFINQ